MTRSLIRCITLTVEHEVGRSSCRSLYGLSGVETRFVGVTGHMRRQGLRKALRYARGPVPMERGGAQATQCKSIWMAASDWLQSFRPDADLGFGLLAVQERSLNLFSSS